MLDETHAIKANRGVGEVFLCFILKTGAVFLERSHQFSSIFVFHYIAMEFFGCKVQSDPCFGVNIVPDSKYMRIIGSM